MKDKIVCIEWEDAAYNSGYYDKHEPPTPILTRTVGHLVKKTKQAVIVSQDRFYEKGKISGDRHLGIIPKKMIKKITEIGGDK